MASKLRSDKRGRTNYGIITNNLEIEVSVTRDRYDDDFFELHIENSCFAIVLDLKSAQGLFSALGELTSDGFIPKEES
jgi:hypothetical protein